MNEQKPAFSLDNPSFSGKRWGIRVVILFMYYAILSTAGYFTATVAFSAVGMIWISIFVLLILTIIVQRFTKNMFLRTYRQRGFFCLLFLIISFTGITDYNSAERKMNAYLESPEYQKRLDELLSATDSGELPYTSTLEAQEYFYAKFPLLRQYAHEMWHGRLRRDTGSGLFWFYIFAFGISATRYWRAGRRLRAAQGAPPEDETGSIVEETDLPEPERHMPDLASNVMKDNAEVEATDQRAATSSLCPNCQQECDCAYAYCPDCGSNLGSPECIKCGERFKDDAKFCPHCGEQRR